MRSQAVLHDVFHQRSAAAKLRTELLSIVLLTLIIEALGAVILFTSLPSNIRSGPAAFHAVFHAVSAFCNAGFSTFSENLVAVRGQTVFMTTIAGLIVLGGLGYTVVLEMLVRARRRLTHQPNAIAASLNTRVVLRTSALLIVVGAVFLCFFGLTGETPNWASRIGHALFQSVTARTAGFNTVQIGRLPTACLLWLVLLMFVGGSPGSCAGGVKTTTLAIWLARLRARLGHREDVTIGGRRIPVDVVRRTGLLLGVTAVFNLFGIMFLAASEMGGPQAAFRLEDIIFEQASAFGTVGLSCGITPALSLAGKLWIIMTMFVGRLGPLTIAMAVMERRPAVVRLAEERLMIG